MENSSRREKRAGGPANKITVEIEARRPSRAARRLAGQMSERPSERRNEPERQRGGAWEHPSTSPAPAGRISGFLKISA